MNNVNVICVWVLVFMVTALFFYGLDHLVMTAQGLPLNLDLTPAQ